MAAIIQVLAQAPIPQALALLESVQKLNDHGIEVSSGIIFGFDTDGPDTAEKAIAFITETHIPMVVFNLLYALPSTPLWRRLEKEGRLIPDSQADETNIRFKLPYKVVTSEYRKAIEALYDPPALYERYHSTNLQHIETSPVEESSA